MTCFGITFVIHESICVMAICFLHSSSVCEVPVTQNSILSAEAEQDKDCCCRLRMYPGHRTCSRDIPFLEHPSGTTCTVYCTVEINTFRSRQNIIPKVVTRDFAVVSWDNIVSNSVVTL